MRKWFWLILAIGWLLFLKLGAGPLPGLGPLFEVSTGIWDHHPSTLESRTLSGLKDKVTVTIDQSGVPHIFARNESDLYLAQGFVMAQARLFQMDISTRVTAGMLSELVGERGLAFDEFFVKFGMRGSVDEMWRAIGKEPRTRAMLEAFVTGVNLYVDQLQEPPPEYKILNVKPQRFSPERFVHMGKALTFNLAGRTFDLELSQIAGKFGVEHVLDLFPQYLPAKFEDFVDPRPHGKAPLAEPTRAFQTSFKEFPSFPWANPGQGSNNWAVAPAKSASGTSLFANDTHLGLTLPNIWFETQLYTPDFNAYGVSLAALPGLVNGFNKDIAWGPTNGTTDVLDFYEIEFEDETSARYLVNQQWYTGREEKQIVKIKGGNEKEIVVMNTHLGVLLHRQGKLGLVADWAGHRPGNELLALRGLLNAANVDECLLSFSDWRVPIQNFLCVDKTNIAWTHAGFVPKRPAGQGRFVMDGRTARVPLIEELPESDRPQARNPAQGFLRSANEKILPPSAGIYLGWDYEPPNRGQRIQEALQAKDKWTPEDMIALQNDVRNVEAMRILPHLLRLVKQDELTSGQREALELLRAWDYRVLATRIEATLYAVWTDKFKEKIFGDDVLEEGKRKLMPRDARLAWLLARLEANPNDPDAKWVDDRATDAKETLTGQATRALQATWNLLIERLGPDPKLWTWRNWQQPRFLHAGRLPGFGSDVLTVDGSNDTVSAVAKAHGPTYRVVVETGEWPKAWMQVPGGNNGDPFATDFERFVTDWSQGRMRQVEFYRDMEEAKKAAVRIVEFTPSAEVK